MERAIASDGIKQFELEVLSGTEDFDSIVRLYRPKIFRFILASLRNRDVAENLTQDCFLKAYKAYAQFRNDCSVNTWLMQIAANLIRDHARNRRLQFWSRVQSTAKPPDASLPASIAGTQSSPETQAVLKQEVEAIWDAAARLPERQRTVFLLRFVEDMDLLEIAAATGLKEGTVKAHLFRALQAVRQYMEPSK